MPSFRSFLPDHNFVTLYAPRGANAHFALGMAGRGGGFGLQSDRVADQDVFIAVRRAGQIEALPFFKAAAENAAAAFQGEQATQVAGTVRAFAPDTIERAFGWATDRWRAPGLMFEVVTPVSGVPDPEHTPTADLARAIRPALVARLTIDNRLGATPIQGIFAVRGQYGLRFLADETDGALGGFASVNGYGVAYRTQPGVSSAADFDLDLMFSRPRPLPFRLATMGVILLDVPAGEARSLDLALGWYRAGVVTTGPVEAEYRYTHHYPSLAAVLASALDDGSAEWAAAEAHDQRLAQSGLNTDRQFILAQATRCYYASTMLFAQGAAPELTPPAAAPGVWAVNEGTFMMLNTFDLAVDHLFFELAQHPWAVRNVLDLYVEGYSYTDQVYDPKAPDVHYPGGLAFTHDMGGYHAFSPQGYSSYELSDQPGCFSYMTHEQVVNWILCAATYARTTGDQVWTEQRREVFVQCLESLLQRDHHDPALRDGVMDLESSRCGTSAEITTYDSLDPSLGQSRRNLYLAVKTWAAYLALEQTLTGLGDPTGAAEARAGAARAAATIEAAFDPALGFIPALLDGHDRSPIIPAIEGLIFPHALGLSEALAPDGPYAGLIDALGQHLRAILNPGLCLFSDGGWKLSAHSDNSWVSKIFLCQFIAERLLAVPADPTADRAHANWWRHGCPTNPGIDQIFAGTTPERSFHYPRAITSYLWMT
jgi:hypothetical protein